MSKASWLLLPKGMKRQLDSQVPLVVVLAGALIVAAWAARPRERDEAGSSDRGMEQEDRQVEGALQRPDSASTTHVRHWSRWVLVCGIGVLGLVGTIAGGALTKNYLLMTSLAIGFVLTFGGA